MRLSHLLFAAGFIAFLAVSPVFAQDKVIARVDGSEIKESDIAAAIEDIGQQGQQMNEAQKRDYALQYLIDLKLVVKAAEKEKLAESADFARRLASARERLLMEAFLTRTGDKAASDATMKAFYEETVKGLKPEPEVRASHILVETEDQAKAALERIKKGEDFAKLAVELSKDPGSGKEGGDLGFFTADRMVKEFSETAFALKPGEVSGIVKSQFGFHIIKTEERRDKTPPPFEDVKDQVKRYLVQKAQQDLVLALRKDAKIENLEPAKP